MRRILCAFFFAIFAGTAHAQTVDEPRTYPAERMRLAVDRQGLLDVEWGSVISHLSWDLGMWAGFAKNPLVLYRTSDGQRIGALVSDRVGFGLTGAIGFADWIEIGFELPLVFFQNRPQSQSEISALPFQALSAANVGDLRLVPKLRILRSDLQGIDLALIFGATAPTAQRKDYQGEANFTFQPEIALSRQIYGLKLALNAGAVVRQATVFLNQTVEHELTLRGGVGYHLKAHNLPAFFLDVTVFASTSLLRPFRSFNQTAVELKGQLGYEIAHHVAVFVGGGVGLTRGWGIPDWRVFAGVRVGDVKQAKDSDRDGLNDDDEAKLGTDPNDKDTDKDGVLDGEERKPGDDTDGDGLPNARDPDSDNDGLTDGVETGVPGLDQDPKTTTDPLVKDTDRGGVDDGAEDANKNGRRDPHERNAIDGADDLAPIDEDRDGVADKDDRCQDEAEDKDGFEDQDGCPELDNDRDGAADKDDRCPNQAEDKDNFEDTDGCPDLDNDRDGVPDTRDSCGDVAGHTDNYGCPDTDRDTDGVVDRLDNCPDETGVTKNSGCKEEQLVALAVGKVELKDKIYFKLDSDFILPRSLRLIKNIARVINNHPEHGVVRIEGHTDNIGVPKYNLELSDRRAKSVMRALIEQGVAAERLIAKGYGEGRPMMSNKNERGRARNRRVEFIVVGGAADIEAEASSLPDSPAAPNK
ncbi:MAG: OmpA family protein [Deltaproteobacteria bacterium]|nr:OmpA family protein [Deltaproteobacteria bacterium]